MRKHEARDSSNTLNKETSSLGWLALSGSIGVDLLFLAVDHFEPAASHLVRVVESQQPQAILRLGVV